MWDFDSLYASLQRVKENHGCAGVDGVTIEQFGINRDINRDRHYFI